MIIFSYSNQSDRLDGALVLSWESIGIVSFELDYVLLLLHSFCWCCIHTINMKKSTFRGQRREVRSCADASGPASLKRPSNRLALAMEEFRVFH